jgi:hypothetical protein
MGGSGLKNADCATAWQAWVTKNRAVFREAAFFWG